MTNREIKFRAWLKEDGVMINWYPQFFSDMSPVTNFDSEFPNDHNIILMQSTGIFAKNGEIYEGDLINSFQNDYMPTEVFWDSDCAQFSTQNYHSTLSLVDSINSETEILGNIYENPELLK